MLRVIYGGSPQASAKAFELILKDSAMSAAAEGEEYKIVGVLTNPPAAQGRHKELIPTEVEHYARIWNEARNDNIAILTPEHIAAPEREAIKVEAQFHCDEQYLAEVTALLEGITQDLRTKELFIMAVTNKINKLKNELEEELEDDKNDTCN